MFKNWVRDIVKDTVERISEDNVKKIDDMHRKFRTIESLEEEISKLKIEKSVKEEEFARRERDVTHKLGLERIRQEQDAEATKRTLQLDIREGNISAEEKRFREQMEFQRKHLEDQINSLNVLVEKVFEKLPQVTHNTNVQLEGKVK
jgi:hypothetical protein